VGIDNGRFVDLAVDPQVVAGAASGNFGPLAEWKAAHRRSFLDALGKLQPRDEAPLWGDIARFEKDDAPWFVMAGRDDSRQKGYDVLARAAELFLENQERARFLFFPIPGDEGRAGLGFLRKLAQRFPHSVLVFPFLFREGFVAALRGASYGVMPSLYEPFGMANEFYLNGTVAIGRATGGIIQQIAPLRDAASFGEQVQDRAARWHPPGTQPTGFLFREQDGLRSAAADWRAVNSASYDRNGGDNDRVHERRQYPLFQSMADELHGALSDAVGIARDQPALYFRMLAAGISHIQTNFSWNRAALEYMRHVAQ
jgi:glycogen synthase